MGKRLAKKVLVIGWDAADWKIIKPLMDTGKMPTLKKFLAEGTWGNIATLDPPLSPMLWTSIATGKRADQHGILGFVEPSADNKGVKPVSSTSRKVKAIWNILNQQGMKSNVVGWWPSHPAEPINGVMVSNFYQHCSVKYGDEWPLLKGVVHPERLHDEMANLRVHPVELTMAHILPFVPNARKIDVDKDQRLFAVSKVLSHCASIHNAATYLMEEEEWDFMAVYHDAIDHFSHLAMKYHPPQMKGLSDEDYKNYKHVVTGGYLFHDMMLERMLNLIDDDTTVMIISDHGFHSDHLRPTSLPDEPAAPAHEHRPYGIFAIKGPNIKKGEQVFGASIIDVTPTLLALYGLPIGKDMEGKPLVECFTENPFLEHIESWEKVDGIHGMHDENLQEDKWANQEALDQLVELGYIEKPDENQAKAVENAKNESKFYLARNLIDGNKIDKAIPILEELIITDKKAFRFYEKLAVCYMNKKMFKECEQLLIDARKNIEVEKLPPLVDFYEADLYARTNRLNLASKKFTELELKFPKSASIQIELAKIEHSKQNWSEAEIFYAKAIDIDPGNSVARHGLGLCKLRQEKPEEALIEFFNVIEHTYFYPQCHYHIAEALVQLEKYSEAAQAFELTLTMAPKMTRARKWLIDIYENYLNDNEKVLFHKEKVKEASKGDVVIVSGLPRSGTSMMMQMLTKGGLKALVDENREADKNNPKGYYEYEPVKRLANDNSWMHLASGKVIKVIAQLLPSLPPNFNYKIIFMQREMDEVLVSQQIMLGKKKEKAEKTFSLPLAETYKKQIEKTNTWLDSQPNIDILPINYAEVINHPQIEAEKINAFLGNILSQEKMVQVVDSNLYRSKVKK
ncbi:MAG: alkaline phosphatase family protein [Vicingaceae bacterium]|nr:alkaline phosphatase family protein [Vicingaceae bacterium]